MRRNAVTRGGTDPFGAPSVNGNSAASMTLIVMIDVLVDAKGTPVSIRVTEPSGDMAFDRSSVDAAVRSTYDPAKAKCVATPGHYTFTETLGPIP